MTAALEDTWDDVFCCNNLALQATADVNACFFILADVRLVIPEALWTP